MSWDADLYDLEGNQIASFNYTHNTNGMIEATLTGDEIDTTTIPWWVKLGGWAEMGRGAWWDLLNGTTITPATALLDRIITGLEAEPDRFRAMNPDNGWGNYDSLLGVFHEMRAACDRQDAYKWEVWG